jgi:hypothetical protein
LRIFATRLVIGRLYAFSPIETPPHALSAAALGDRADVRRLRALLPLARLELDLRALNEALEALAVDAAVVDEEVFAALVGRDEAVPIVVVEPLDDSCCRCTRLPA